MKKIFLLTTALLTACATVDYEEPIAGDRARVRFALETFNANFLTESAGGVDIYGVANEQCEEPKKWLDLNGGGVFGEKRSLEMPLNTYNGQTAKEFYIDSSSEKHFFFHSQSNRDVVPLLAIGGTKVYSCGVVVKWDFQANKDYELLFKKTAHNRCQVILNQIVVADEGHEKNELKVFKTKGYLNDRGCAVLYRDLTNFY